MSAAPDRVVSVGVTLAVVAMLVQSLSHLAYSTIDSDVGQLNADAEESVWSWASTAATFSAAFAVLLLAAVDPGHGRARLLLATLLALLSLDEAVRLHETHGKGFVLLALALALVLLLRESRRAEQRVGELVAIGCALLVATVALDAAATALEADTRLGAIEIAAEEGAELGGWILIATALAAAFLRARRVAR